MTDKQINIAIAEAQGLTRESLGPDWDKRPDYCNDLNAMHEAEKVLISDASMRRSYLEWLGWIDDYITSAVNICHAAARQRAEAFLRTIGKWEESSHD